MNKKLLFIPLLWSILTFGAFASAWSISLDWWYWIQYSPNSFVATDDFSNIKLDNIWSYTCNRDYWNNYPIDCPSFWSCRCSLSITDIENWQWTDASTICYVDLDIRCPSFDFDSDWKCIWWTTKILNINNYKCNFVAWKTYYFNNLDDDYWFDNFQFINFPIEDNSSSLVPTIPSSFTTWLTNLVSNFWSTIVLRLPTIILVALWITAIFSLFRVIRWYSKSAFRW